MHAFIAQYYKQSTPIKRVWWSYTKNEIWAFVINCVCLFNYYLYEECFYHNFIKIILKKTPPLTNANKHLGFATFILKYQQLHRKLKQNPQKFLNLPSVKKLQQSTLGGLRLCYQNIKLNRYKVGKENLVLTCVGIVEAIIAWTIDHDFQSCYRSLNTVDWENQADLISARERDIIICYACKVLLKLGKFLIMRLKK